MMAGAERMGRWVRRWSYRWLRYSRLMAVLLFVGTLSSAMPVAAETPIDPLHLRQSAAGEYEYTVRLSLAPFAATIVAVDEQGNPVPVVATDYTVGLHADFQQSLTDRLALALDVQTSGTASKLTPITQTWQWSAVDWHGAAGLTWRFAPRAMWDPTMTVNTRLDGSGATGARLVVQRVSDPLVIVGSVNVSHSRAQVGIGAALGMGFVVNDEFSLSANVAHRFAWQIDPLPATSLTVGLHRGNRAGTGTIGFDTTLTAHGAVLGVLLGVTWNGSGAFGRDQGNDFASGERWKENVETRIEKTSKPGD